jgi:hypothetical protein
LPWGFYYLWGCFVAVKLEPYELRGLPNPRIDKGVRLLSLKQVEEILRTNPYAREAIARINMREGVPRMVQKVLHEHAEKNKAVIENNKFVIDQQLKRERGIIE